MKILSIDTASDVCGVSILEDNKLICNLDENTGRTHSENLMPMIQEAFNKTNLQLKDIDLIICDKGPGSFTGIRIGIATTKGFSDSLDIPTIGVSSLEVFAYNKKDELNENDYICSVIDCKNDNCYYALYQFKNNSFVEIVSPCADSISILETLKNKYTNITFTGDVYGDKLNSYSLGLAGLDKYNNKQFDDVLPLYLKKPQAQIQLEQGLLKTNN